MESAGFFQSPVSEEHELHIVLPSERPNDLERLKYKPDKAVDRKIGEREWKPQERLQIFKYEGEHRGKAPAGHCLTQTLVLVWMWLWLVLLIGEPWYNRAVGWNVPGLDRSPNPHWFNWLSCQDAAEMTFLPKGHSSFFDARLLGTQREQSQGGGRR